MNYVKRESGYGGSPVVTGAAAAADKPTLDILTSTNVRRKRIWAKSDWDWKYEALAIPMAPSVVVYGVTAMSGNAIDRIRNLIPYSPTAIPPVAGPPLKQRTERQFRELQYAYQDGAYGTGAPPAQTPRWYLNLGKNAAGIWQVEIFPAPSSAFVMGGSAKAILNTYLIGDVTGIPPFSPGNLTGAANPPLDYFPDGVIENILFEGVMSDVSLILKDPADAKAKDASFENKISVMAAEQAEAAKDNTPMTSPLPAVVLRRRIRRRGGC